MTGLQMKGSSRLTLLDLVTLPTTRRSTVADSEYVDFTRSLPLWLVMVDGNWQASAQVQLILVGNLNSIGHK